MARHAGRHRAERRTPRSVPVVLAVVALTALAGSGWAVLGERVGPAAADASWTAVDRANPGTGASNPTSTAPVAVQPGVTVEPEVFALPADSGRGRRVVFSQSEQRVWLVEDGAEVARTYPVSGSIYDNLFPGTYAVFSRSRHATAFDYSGTMEYFVRFTHGTGGSAIGFHDIPRSDGELAQSVAELGTPQSHGCIRQQRRDAIALWEFADIGTTVVVTP